MLSEDWGEQSCRLREAILKTAIQVSLRNAGLKSLVKALSRALTPETWLRLLGDQPDRQLKAQDK